MIEEKLNEIRKYFADKLLSGEYEFISCTDCYATINIEGYKLNVWIANDPKNHLGFYEPTNTYFFVNQQTFRSKDERLEAWNKLKPHIIKYKENQLRKEKERQIEQLQKELKSLNDEEIYNDTQDV